MSTACGQRAPGQVQQLEHLVEAGRVAGPRRAHRVDAVEVALDEGGGEERLAGPHPVAVAGQGVDLPVVGHVAVRVGQGPAGEGVGREARVHQGQPRLEERVLEVGEERAQLLGGQHALVDDGPRRQRGEVQAVDGVLGPLAQDEGPALEGQRVGGRRRRLPAAGRPRRAAPWPAWRPAPSRPARRSTTGTTRQPSTDRPSSAARASIDLLGLGRVVVLAGQEGQADGVGAGVGQGESGRLRRADQEPVRHLDQNAGAVTGGRPRPPRHHGGPGARAR